MNVTRAQVLAYRYARHGLGEGAPDDALLTLGVQDSPAGSAAQALAVRGLDEKGLVTVWSFRGAPHRHRSGDLRRLSAAAWPLSAADAASRLAGFGSTLRKAERSGLVAMREAAAAIADVVTGPGTSKSDLSSGVTKRVDELYSFWCRGCGATHVHDQLLRLTALHAGVRLDASAPVTFAPIARWPGVPAEAKGAEALVLAYLTLHGPATPGDAGGFLGTTAANVKPAWPADGLAEVRVDGRKAWLPEDSLDALRSAPKPEGVRLLPPSDPYLQMRDRELLVPDPAHRKALWPVLAWPGAVVSGGEVTGYWRAKQGAKGRLAVTVTAWGKAPRKGVESEAARVASLRGAEAVDVTFAE
ncbi:MAG TPA: winged helix DNA-binding domain-containing protein [Mycobacteriales bacterium]|nr:winged helix DNA-binding domain-containing protein [Mycobacteriales bacterium]